MRVNVVLAKQRSLKPLLPIPTADANKYTRGKLTVIGGSARYPGSACLAGAAAFRTGAGYVECLCAPETVPLIQGYMASLVARPWDAEAVRASLDAPVDEHHPQACLIGCGMEDDGAHQRALVEEALTTCTVPLILDGGALRVVGQASLQALLQERALSGRPTAMTPHGGEAAALARSVGISAPDEGAPLESLAAFAYQIAAAFRCTVLLKGPQSFIATAAADSPSEGSSSEEPTVFLMDRGSAALAKAGTGDVLAGMVGALMAQGQKSGISCVLASVLHAEAARSMVREMGAVSVCAEDVLGAIPDALSMLC